MRPALAVLLGAILFLGAGCSGDTTGPAPEEKVALFGYLYVGEAITEENALYLTRTRPVDAVYDPMEAGVRGALVTLRKEGATAEDTLGMVLPGYYAHGGVVIEARTTYHLRVVLEDGGELTASTTTPDSIAFLREPAVLPDSMAQSRIAFDHPIVIDGADPEQILLVDVYCLEDYRSARYIHPFGPEDYPQDYKEYGGDDGPPRHIFAYLRLKNLERAPDGYLISWYGDMMAFYGSYDVGVYAIDENYYNYLYRDHPELNGGVSGGIGVFGSACRGEYRVRAVE